MSQKSYDESCAVYLIPTPIGNMEDITLRALRLLNEVSIIFSEDTRNTHQLLSYYKIQKPMISSHQHNEQKNKEKLLHYLKNNQSVAIVTDRGTPIISDPGYILASFAIEQGYSVIGLPGPTAFVPALICSGLPAMPFLFFGFLNAKEAKRKKELMDLKTHTETLIFYEAPHRIESTLLLMKSIFGNRRACIARELSKKFEEIYRGTLESLLFETSNMKGEIVLLVEGNANIDHIEVLSISEEISLYQKDGYSTMDAMKAVAKNRGLSKSEVYKEYHKE